MIISQVSSHPAQLIVDGPEQLVEINLGNNADAYNRGEHNGWIPTCWEGIEMSVDILNERRIKLIVNGGCLNPKGLAEKTDELVKGPRE